MLKMSRVRPKTLWLVPAVVGIAATCAESIQAESPPPTTDSVLRLARSRDGRRFTDTGVLFVNHAGAPNLVRLRNGDLLAVFDPLRNEGREEVRVMAASSSSDLGRSWSPVRPIRVRARTGQSIRVEHAALVQMPDRRCRMFFTMPPTHNLKQARRSARSRTVLAAVTNNGFDWQLDERVAVEFPVTPDQHPTAGWVGDELHLFLASPSGVDAGRAHHAVSHAGRRFTKPARVRVPHVHFVGSIVPMGRRARAYAFDDDGVRSLVSRNGRDWKLEPGIRIANAWDPAVIRLRDGSFLMLYCTWAKQGEAAAQLADTSEYETGGGGHSGVTITAVADVEIVDEPAGSELEDEAVAGENAGYESDDSDESGEWHADAPGRATIRSGWRS